MHHLDEAQQHLARGIELYDRFQHRSLAFTHIQDLGVSCYCILGRTCWYNDKWDDALNYTKEGLELARQLDHPYTLIFAQVYYGMLLISSGNPIESLPYLELAQKECFSRRFWFWHAVATILRCQVKADGGKAREFTEEARQAVKVYESTGAKIALPWILGVAGYVHAKACDFPQAFQLLNDALEQTSRGEKHEQLLDEPELFRLKGEAHALQGDMANAIICFKRAMECASTNRTPGWKHCIQNSVAAHGLSVANHY
jgi:tetratricopeptide (TPR) repeat protein